MGTEIWKDIPGYEGRYQVSTEGNIRSIWARTRPPKQLKPYWNKVPHTGGSPRREIVLVNAAGVKRRLKLAVLVFKTFKGERPEGYVIVHKNGDLMDDSVNNLILMTQQEAGRKLGGRQESRRPVAQCKLTGEVVRIFPSVRKAAKETGLAHSSIRDFCNGKMGPMARDGYMYRWDDDFEY